MAPEQHRSRALATACGGRFDLCWALLAALLIVMGWGAPGSASVRPAAEYSERLAAAPAGVTFAVAAAAAVLRPDGQEPAAAALGPSYGFTASSVPCGLVPHDYQAIGPPGTGLSQPA